MIYHSFSSPCLAESHLLLLRYASRARNIKNHAVKNTDPNDAKIAALKREVCIDELLPKEQQVRHIFLFLLLLHRSVASRASSASLAVRVSQQEEKEMKAKKQRVDLIVRLNCRMKKRRASHSLPRLVRMSVFELRSRKQKQRPRGRRRCQLRFPLKYRLYSKKCVCFPFFLSFPFFPFFSFFLPFLPLISHFLRCFLHFFLCVYLFPFISLPSPCSSTECVSPSENREPRGGG